MPGKYSHSVVLADYSSRGLIALPNDQHIAYLRSSAYPPSSYSKTSTRAQSQASRPNSSHGRSQSNSSYRERQTPTKVAFSSPRHRMIVDPALAADKETVDASNLRNAAPSPIISRETNRTGNLSDLRRSQNTVTPVDRPSTASTTASSSKRSVKSPSVPLLDSPSYGSSSVRKPGLELRKDQQKSPNITRLGKDLETAKVVSPPAIKSKTKVDSTANGKSETTIASPKSATKPTKRFDPLAAHPPQVDILRHIESPELINTQNHRPLSTIDEPDFNGFSDAEETKTFYFENNSQPRATGRPDGGLGMLSILRNSETPPPRQSTMSRTSQTRTFNSSSTAPSENQVKMSPDGFHNKLDSLTSQSSLESWGAAAAASRISKQTEIKKPQEQERNVDWHLPEIDERRDFGPEIFAQGLHDDVSPISTDLGFGGSRLGMISSGKDFDADDAVSLASTACPPNISRFREDDVPPVPFLHLPGKKSSDNWTASPNTTPSKAKKGLFSRLRAKSRSRD